MSKRHWVLQVLQFLGVVVFTVGSANAQLPSRLHAPLVRLPAGEIDVATAALAGPDNKTPAYVAAVPPTLNAPSLNAPLPQVPAAQTFDPLAPPQIEGADGADSWAPPLPPEKSAAVKADKPRLLDRIRQRWTRGGTKPAGADPADQTPQIGPAGENRVATTPPAVQSTAKRGWFNFSSAGR